MRPDAKKSTSTSFAEMARMRWWVRRGQRRWPLRWELVAAVVGMLGVLCAVRADSSLDCYVGAEFNNARQEVNNLYEKCVLPDRRQGICLNDYQCHPNMTIACGGNMLDSDVRINDKPLSECGGFLWCCTYESEAAPTPAPMPSPTPAPMLSPTPSLTPAPIPAPTGVLTLTPAPTPVPTPVPTTRSTFAPPQSTDCQLAFGDCPWCVALYRSGGDPRRWQRTESGLYCAGALIGTRAVLTSASCVRAVGRERVWARLPAARDPARQYHVISSLTHRNYSSGSHENDFALFMLEEDVEWSMSGGGACVQTSLQGYCFAPGFDSNENLVLTPITVRDGSCRPRRRSISDMACGVSMTGRCAIAPGAPVLCSVVVNGQGGQAVAGVVRQHCIRGSMQFGRLQQHADWLRAQLLLFGVQDSQYTLRT